MKRTSTSLLRVVVGVLSLPFLLRGNKMDTKPRETGAADETEHADKYEQIPPPTVLLRPDEDGVEPKRGTSDRGKDAKPSLKSRWEDSDKRWQTIFTGIIAG